MMCQPSSHKTCCPKTRELTFQFDKKCEKKNAKCLIHIPDERVECRSSELSTIFNLVLWFVKMCLKCFVTTVRYLLKSNKTGTHQVNFSPEDLLSTRHVCSMQQGQKSCWKCVYILYSIYI